MYGLSWHWVSELANGESGIPGMAPFDDGECEVVYGVVRLDGQPRSQPGRNCRDLGLAFHKTFVTEQRTIHSLLSFWSSFWPLFFFGCGLHPLDLGIASSLPGVWLDQLDLVYRMCQVAGPRRSQLGCALWDLRQGGMGPFCVWWSASLCTLWQYWGCQAFQEAQRWCELQKYGRIYRPVCMLKADGTWRSELGVQRRKAARVISRALTR